MVSSLSGKRSKASEVGGMASVYLPLRVNRSLRESFTFLQVLVRSYMMVAYRSRILTGITLSTTFTIREHC